LSEETTEVLLHAFVSSKLDNGNALLHGLPKNLLNKLQLVQNTAARIVTLTRKHDHITPTLNRLHWLPVEQPIIFKLLLLVYKGLNGLAPSYISELLHYRTYKRSLRSSNQGLLDVPYSKLKTYGDRSFSVAAPKLWNILPTDIKQAKNVNIFKNKLKTHLFYQAYDI
jgi:hypothetical protein